MSIPGSFFNYKEFDSYIKNVLEQIYHSGRGIRLSPFTILNSSIKDIERMRNVCQIQ